MIIALTISAPSALPITLAGSFVIYVAAIETELFGFTL